MSNWGEQFMDDLKRTKTPRPLVSTEVPCCDADLTEALRNLIAIGLACERCGMNAEQCLWATDTHSIKVKHLLALQSLQAA